VKPGEGEITSILEEWSRGEPGALERLYPLVVRDLRRAAAHYLKHEDPEHAPQPTALIDAVYLRLLKRRAVRWDNRAQFFSFAGELMRFVLVDCARERKALARGGGIRLESLTAALGIADAPAVDPDTVLDLERALKQLKRRDPRAVRVIELRFFCGMTEAETAKALGISVSTMKRDWESARQWLALELGGGGRSDFTAR
jgi:RNA polymerase sigma factor (TIGR02999 family)